MMRSTRSPVADVSGERPRGAPHSACIRRPPPDRGGDVLVARLASRAYAWVATHRGQFPAGSVPPGEPVSGRRATRAPPPPPVRRVRRASAGEHEPGGDEDGQQADRPLQDDGVALAADDGADRPHRAAGTPRRRSAAATARSCSPARPRPRPGRRAAAPARPSGASRSSRPWCPPRPPASGPPSTGRRAVRRPVPARARPSTPPSSRVALPRVSTVQSASRAPPAPTPVGAARHNRGHGPVTSRRRHRSQQRHRRRHRARPRRRGVPGGLRRPPGRPDRAARRRDRRRRRSPATSPTATRWPALAGGGRRHAATCWSTTPAAPSAPTRSPTADADDWRAMYEVNVLGTLQVTQALLPALRASRRRPDRQHRARPPAGSPTRAAAATPPPSTAPR